MAEPRVSLCAIVRDEAALLPDCIHSVRPFVDEIVVVDTGSVDETLRVAREVGAVALERPWDDDFAAARNAALDACHGEWILSLDADERLAPGAGERIREAVARPDIDACSLVFHNARSVDAALEDVVAGRGRAGLPVKLARLFRNVDGLRWTRPVHETVDPWLSRRRDRIADLDAHAVHLGYARDAPARPRKVGRNLRILEAYCPTAPDDFVAWSYLAFERDTVGDLAGAWEAVERGWQVLHEAMLDPLAPTHFANLAAKRARLQLASGDLGRAASTLEQAWMWGADHPNLDFTRGVVHEVQAHETANAFNRVVHLEQALRRYRRVQERQGDAFCEEALPATAAAGLAPRLASVHVQLRDPEAALAALEAQDPLDEPSFEARLLRVEALQDLGRSGEAALLLDSIPDLPFVDAQVLRARASSGPVRAVLLRLLAQTSGARYLAPHRMRILARLLQEDREALAALKTSFHDGDA